jgi:phosphopantothenoylcysteine decarboxylase / phosphopantothenate---cysteine ligase
MSRILLGVSGGIAAYKALELIRLATAAGHAVRVVQTPASRRFVGEASFEALTGAPVLSSEFQRDPARGAFPGQPLPEHEPLSHLQLVANADVYAIVPASANTIAKLAAGFADNLLSSCALAADCPLVVAPAMNNRMYEHPATQANLALLRERGAWIVDPGSGRLASLGEEGIGRLADHGEILAACEQAIAATGTGAETQDGSGGPVDDELEDAGPRVESDTGSRFPTDPGSWRGLNVLVTAGGTREPIDSVRFVGNSSSGRMGLALAERARARGASVTVIAANVALEPPLGVEWRGVKTAAELASASGEEFPACDVLLMSAAVADFRPSAPVADKLKKAGRDGLKIELEPTADVLADLSAARRSDQTLVGFAAEHGERAVENARAKLTAKNLDAVVVNDISRPGIGFDSDENEVTILTAHDERHVSQTSKVRVAEAILDAVERLRRDRQASA